MKIGLDPPVKLGCAPTDSFNAIREMRVTPEFVNTEAACDSLVRYLYSKTRKLPVLVISQRRDNTGPCVKGPQFQELIGPVAKVFTLSGGALKQFNRLLDNFYGIEPSGVRLYLPRMTSNDYPTRHRVWNELRIDTEFDTPEAFMQSVKKFLYDRVAFFENQKQHSTGTMSFERAERLLFGGTPKSDAPQTVHVRSGRKVLTVAKPKPSQEQLSALQQRFAR